MGRRRRDADPRPAGRRDEDLGDPHIPNLIWWAFERQLRQDRDAVVALAEQRREIQRVRDGHGRVLERAARALASEGSDGDFAACARLLAAAPGEEQAARIVAGMEQGARGADGWRRPPALAEPLARLWAAAQPAPGVVLIRLAARMGSPPAIEAAVKMARDPRAAGVRPDRHDRAARSARPGRRRARARSRSLGHDPSPAIQLAAVARAGGLFSSRRSAAPLLARYRSAAPAVRDRILGLLCTRRAWARALLDAVEPRRIAAKELTPAHVQLIAQLSDPALLSRLEAVWGKVPRPGSPEKKRRIAEVRGLLPEGDKGNAARGKPIFKENCAVCHKLFDEGESIGPELTGADRGNLDFLMTSLVDPSALVRKEYQSQTIALRDGRVLTGLVVDENDRVLTLVDSNRQKTVIARDAIEAVQAVGGFAHARRDARQADRAPDPRSVSVSAEPVTSRSTILRLRAATDSRLLF